jgi:rfaE bifunctional protein kinase chain/domain
VIRVIGDIILDRWITGDVNRLSPEAPVPVLLETKNYYTLGGAANVAKNISNMNADITLYGTIATDEYANTIKKLLNSVPHQLIDCRTKTTVKTRLVTTCGKHLLRWDNESKESHHPRFREFSETDIVLISDYDKGDVTKELVSKYAKTNKVFVDPIQEPDIYANAFLVKPNMKEFLTWTNKFDLVSAQKLMDKYNWNWLVVTDGGNGIHLFEKDTDRHDHFTDECGVVADVTGAGDVVVSTIVVEYLKGNQIPEACRKANKNATECVQKKGTSLFCED